MAFREEFVYSRMRMNVRKTVQLKFKHYELRIEAEIEPTFKGDKYKMILPLIKIRYLKRYYVREEIIFELKRLNKVKNADLRVEFFAVYGTQNAIGEYKRYLGEMFLFISSIDKDGDTRYQNNAATLYHEQPDKSKFIDERI